MTIYLSAEVVSGLGEDTFWLWFKREFPQSQFDLPTERKPSDIVLRYATLGPTHMKGKIVALLWELYPEMKVKLHSNEWDHKIAKIMECAKESQYRTVSSPVMKKYYEHLGEVDVLPIGVNADLFKPFRDRYELRKKHNLPIDGQIGFWCGTTHPMKGFNKLMDWVKEHPDIYWIIVWKQRSEAPNWYTRFSMWLKRRFRSYTQISQQTLAELMNASNFFLVTGLLEPFFMVEWEAMACNLPAVFVPDCKKEFTPSSNPRDDVFAKGWDRESAKKTWVKYLSDREVSLE